MEAQSESPLDERTITLFLAAMSRDPAERDTFLAEACSGDAELLDRVKRRVEWEGKLKGFLLRPATQRERLDHPFAPGDRLLDRFRIVRVAGEGGMGVVYEAFDEKLGHRIALKCPRFEFRKRLSPEALRSLRVTHVNVCRVFEIHTAETPSGDVDFLTMELIDGVTLSQKLANAPTRWLETEEGTMLARQMCEGLAAVHGQGIIHRDLKPSNVMAAAGTTRAVLMDFGLAHASDLFSSQIKGGTPAYFAPELWRGNPGTPQSDIYALGVLLFEMAAGRKPFPEGSSWKERLNEAPRLEGWRDPWRAAIERCLHPDPNKRFATVGALMEALWPPEASRRQWITGGALAVAASAAGFLAWDRFASGGSPVRLAILGPKPDAAGAEPIPMIRAFVHDLSYRLKSLRSTRRPLFVLAAEETRRDGLNTPEEAAAAFGATHSLVTQAPGGQFLAALLGPAKPLREWRSSLAAPDLLALQSRIAQGIVEALGLGAEPASNQGIPAPVYADYLEALRIIREEQDQAAEAVRLMESVTARAPGSALAYVTLAEALLTQRFYNRNPELEGAALLALEKAEQLDPRMPQVYSISGRLDLIRGFYQRGLANDRRAAELLPYDPDPRMSMAYDFYMLNRPADAEAALNEAIAINPRYYLPYFDAGFLAQQRRMFALAERHWREGIRLAPATHLAMRLDFAELLVQMGRLAEAESYLKELRRTHPKVSSRALTYTLEAALKEHAGNFPEALALYAQAMKAQRPDYRLHYKTGNCHAKAGNGADARRCFEQGVEATETKLTTNRRQPDALSWLALYHARLGNAPRVQALADEAHGLAGYQQWTVCKLLTLAYGHLNQPATALGLLQSAPADLLLELKWSLDLPPVLRADPRL
jgi:serine/threonine-protein kinase